MEVAAWTRIAEDKLYIAWKNVKKDFYLQLSCFVLNPLWNGTFHSIVAFITNDVFPQKTPVCKSQKYLSLVSTLPCQEEEKRRRKGEHTQEWFKGLHSLHRNMGAALECWTHFYCLGVKCNSVTIH